ncbi:hypothetical protein CFC21_082822 [Triticum aestivum]|uniref:RING-type E3 ubiquitin transferase n=3 Tax=Triticum TaxID=4564 RepID=A0A9R0XXG0_TRITD|nr:putative E3 ubiquitin-protein ligase LIN-1 [Triticum aestivum]KAF7078374.1 hypothetical protein CFC21_082822 [Triticum aestivum]VAI44301.1 unnamed protein product [Triticum turgidum subsp. durum]
MPPPPPSSSSLRDLLARERSELAEPAAPCRAVSSRQAPGSPPPPRGADNAVGTVVSMLSGYAGRFSKDAAFRRALREKCAACLAPAAAGEHAVLLADLELAIESIECLADAAPSPRDSKIRSLRNSIRLLGVVAALHAPPHPAASGDCEGDVRGVPSSHLSACAQLYLAVVYKMESDPHLAARHLLQVFVDAPHVARTTLLPDLWAHVFLPHLLHLEVWLANESELVAGCGDADGRSSSRTKTLQRLYDDQMDSGTAQFAMYYKDWLKHGGDAPPAVPSVPLPSTPWSFDKWEKHSSSLRTSSINRNLYNAVFGTSFEQEDTKLPNEAEYVLDMEVQLDENPGSLKMEKLAHRNIGLQEKQSGIRKESTVPETAPTPRKSYSLRLLSCRGDVSRNVTNHPKVTKRGNVSVEKELDCCEVTVSLQRAVSIISNSDSLTQCEYAVHEIATACSNLGGGPNLGTWMSCPSFIQGLLEVTFTSKDDAVLESAILIMGELVLRNEVNRQIVLNADPQLEVFLRLLALRSNGLFLKATAVLYLMKPRAKQMLSMDWMPLVLHILECGDEVQLVSSLKCYPKMAAFYFLDQLLTGFDIDRNVENAKQMIALGGLDLLMSRLEVGDARESRICISLLTSCVQADGSCRFYLSDHLKKEPLVQLLVGNQKKASAAALNLMSELTCLNRTSQTVEFLKELKSGGCLNTMQVLLVYLQQAPPVQHPLAAVMLLQLDLLGDPLQYSVYREEAVDAIMAALEHSSESAKVQEQCARALLLLAGRFSSSGEPIAEAWLLKRAGVDGSLSESFRRTEIFKNKGARAEEEKVVEERLKKLALVLVKTGNKRFLAALSNCISDGIPALVRACLVTVAWMSSSLSPLHGCNTFQPLACSVLAAKLLDRLSYDRVMEERVLASLSLLNLVRHPECLEGLLPLKRDTTESLRDLADVTWTAKELLFACCR